MGNIIKSNKAEKNKYKMIISKLILISFWCLFIVLQNGCTLVEEDKNSNSIVSTESFMDDDTENCQNTEDLSLNDNAQGIDDEKNKKFFVQKLPHYSGNAYVEVNENQPYFESKDMTNEAFENYSELDQYGRCGVAFANICKDIMPTEPRGPIGFVRPTGWKTVKYNGLIDGNYLYNRCHLIGYQLAGENANERNLITGTRYLNVEGMLPFENQIADYVERTGNHVLYRVTPVFEGDNMLASGVLMEAKSVEDDGNGVCYNVYVFNVQPGIVINYRTGESQLMEGWNTEQDANDSNKPEKGNSSDYITEPGDSNTTKDDDINENDQSDYVINVNDQNQSDYVININTGKFHNPNCKSVSQMKEKNRKDFKGTRDEIISMGYKPCQNCNP